PGGRPRTIEAGDALKQRGPPGGRRFREPPPEGVKSRKSIVRRVSSDQRTIDRTDRRADNPIRLDARMGERLEYARLVRAQSGNALQDQDNLPRNAVAFI